MGHHIERMEKRGINFIDYILQAGSQGYEPVFEIMREIICSDKPKEEMLYFCMVMLRDNFINLYRKGILDDMRKMELSIEALIVELENALVKNGLLEYFFRLDEILELLKSAHNPTNADSRVRVCANYLKRCAKNIFKLSVRLRKSTY